MIVYCVYLYRVFACLMIVWGREEATTRSAEELCHTKPKQKVPREDLVSSHRRRHVTVTHFFVFLSRAFSPLISLPECCGRNRDCGRTKTNHPAVRQTGRHAEPTCAPCQRKQRFKIPFLFLSSQPHSQQKRLRVWLLFPYTHCRPVRRGERSVGVRVVCRTTTILPHIVI
jgi:hypothetical protein